MGQSELSVVLEEGDPDLMAGYLFFPGNDAPYLDSQESQADLSQDLEGSGEQEGESVLTEEGIQSEGEQVEASSCQDDFEDENAMESDSDDLDENFQCPRAEDTVEISGGPECKTCRYVLVHTCRRFAGARVSGREATVEGSPGVGEESGFHLLFSIHLD